VVVAFVTYCLSICIEGLKKLLKTFQISYSKKCEYHESKSDVLLLSLSDWDEIKQDS